MARASFNSNAFGTNKDSTDIRRRPRSIIKPMAISDTKLKRFKDWNTLYRRNMQIFAKHYLQVKCLYPYQEMMLYEIGRRIEVTIVGSRATAKSWVIGLAAICIAILYPRSEIIIVSSTKDQAGIILGKISDFYNEYPNIQREISKLVDNNNDKIAEFRNFSTIKVLACNEGARGKTK
jgi:hypothetical protein